MSQDDVNKRAFEVIEQATPALDAMIGLRTKLVEGGFSDEAAEELVLAMFRKGLDSAGTQRKGRR